MPLDERILGFSNIWYRLAMQSAVWRKLFGDLEIRIPSAPSFVATKFEAFKGRGKWDFFARHDLEDLVAVVDGRRTLVAEVRDAPVELRAYIRAEVRRLLAAPGFADALPGYLLPDAMSQSRITTVLHRLEELSSL